MKVLIAGCFDPLHEGHLDHILKAAKLGDYLIIATHTDECVKKIKGRCYTAEEFRVFMLEAILDHIKQPGEVIVTDDETVTAIIYERKPNILAKGGDRIPSNMPQSEIDAYKAVKCAIAYGVGDLLNSSSAIKAALEVNNESNDY